jgi:hypothetical protein
MKDEKDKHNHTGQTPSDIPSPELINPPKKKGTKKDVSKVGASKTAKVVSRNTNAPR